MTARPLLSPTALFPLARRPRTTDGEICGGGTLVGTCSLYLFSFPHLGFGYLVRFPSKSLCLLSLFFRFVTESIFPKFDLLSRLALVPLLETLDRLGVDRRVFCETYLSLSLSSTIPARPRSATETAHRQRRVVQYGDDGVVVLVAASRRFSALSLDRVRV